MLCFYNYDSSFRLEAAIHCVATAKFMAEKTTGVGPLTAMKPLRQSGEMFGAVGKVLKKHRSGIMTDCTAKSDAQTVIKFENFNPD